MKKLKKLILLWLLAISVLTPTLMWAGVYSVRLPEPPTEPPTKIERFAHAIAKAEGFYRKGTIPNRYFNPGDLKSKPGIAITGPETNWQSWSYCVYQRRGWMDCPTRIHTQDRGRPLPSLFSRCYILAGLSYVCRALASMGKASIQRIE